MKMYVRKCLLLLQLLLVATFFFQLQSIVYANDLQRDTIDISRNTDFAATAKNFVYVEALGSGGLYSISYDRLLSPTWSARLGFSTFGFTLSNLDAGIATFSQLSLVTVPITTAYMVNFPDNSPHHIEFGGGITLVFGSATVDVSNMGYTFTSANGAAGQLLAMYRFQPQQGGFSFRAGFTPFYVITPILTGVLPWAGVSFGGTFGGF